MVVNNTVSDYGIIRALQTGEAQTMRAIVAVLVFILGAAPAAADTIAVIGTGKVGSALGTELAAEGHTIVYGSRDPTRESRFPSILNPELCPLTHTVSVYSPDDAALGPRLIDARRRTLSGREIMRTPRKRMLFSRTAAGSEKK